MMFFILDILLVVLTPFLMAGLFLQLAKYLSRGEAYVSIRKAMVIAFVTEGVFLFAITDRQFAFIFQAAVMVGLPLILVNHVWLHLELGKAMLVSVVFMAYSMSIYEGVPRALSALSPDRHSLGGVIIETLDQYTLGKLEAHEQEEAEKEAREKAKEKKKEANNPSGMASNKKSAAPAKKEEKKEMVRDRFRSSKTVGSAIARAARPTENIDVTFGFAGIMASGYETMDKVKGLQANAARRSSFIDNLTTDTMNQQQMNDSAFEMSDPFAASEGQSVKVAPLSPAAMGPAEPAPFEPSIKAREQPAVAEAPAPAVPAAAPKGLLSVFGDVMKTVKGDSAQPAPSPAAESASDVTDVAPQETRVADSQVADSQAPQDAESIMHQYAIPFNLRGCDPEIRLTNSQTTAALKRMTAEERDQWSSAQSHINVRSVMKLSMGTSAAFINDQLKVPGDTIVVNSEGVDHPYQVVSIQQYEVYFCPFGSNGAPDRRILLRLKL